jgi:hypothetical protein
MAQKKFQTKNSDEHNDILAERDAKPSFLQALVGDSD